MLRTNRPQVRNTYVANFLESININLEVYEAPSTGDYDQLFQGRAYKI